MNGAFPWHALWAALTLGFVWAALLLYLFSFRRYDTYRTAARLLILVAGLLAMVALLSGLTHSFPELPLPRAFPQHRALGITAAILVILSALFALFEPLASWLPVFTSTLLLLAVIASSASWVFGHRLRHERASLQREIFQEIPQEEVVPDTGELWMEEEPAPETPEP